MTLQPLLRSLHQKHSEARLELTCYTRPGPGGQPYPFPAGEIQCPSVHVETKTALPPESCQHTYVQRGFIINNGQLHDVRIHRLGKAVETVNSRHQLDVKHLTFTLVH